MSNPTQEVSNFKLINYKQSNDDRLGNEWFCVNSSLVINSSITFQQIPTVNH